MDSKNILKNNGISWNGIKNIIKILGKNKRDFLEWNLKKKMNEIPLNGLKNNIKNIAGICGIFCPPPPPPPAFLLFLEFRVHESCFSKTGAVGSCSPNIYKEARKTTWPYCPHCRLCVCSISMEESDAWASVGFSPWSAILFPVMSRCYKI